MEKNIQTAVADYLQELVNEYAAQGWEFFRIDDFSTEKKRRLIRLFQYPTFPFFTLTLSQG
ncbi:hypothetical protein [Pasteurella bettyae]|uniref:DUF4177 domain-containing protein n=1 Tax=Pasteurella bettyae CCUG 2042 TaxID=1095749 RepID=I3DK90_9PAST|nr:hypothetical protein [Pasteurella bettyae]EIJ72133.1 hypothetical protein HMPREF1052_2046 [Pasteurella bettyae CCUG 2042]